MEHYKILVSVGTIEISSHDKNWVEEKEKKYSEKINNLLSQSEVKQKNTSNLPNEQKGSSFSPQIGKIPINEFYRRYIHAKEIKSRPDIATFFVYYLVKLEGKEEIPSIEIKNLFRDVQYPGWNKINITDALNKAKKKAFLNSVGNNWSLTITGEDFVLNTMSE